MWSFKDTGYVLTLVPILLIYFSSICSCSGHSVKFKNQRCLTNGKATSRAFKSLRPHCWFGLRWRRRPKRATRSCRRQCSAHLQSGWWLPSWLRWGTGPFSLSLLNLWRSIAKLRLPEMGHRAVRFWSAKPTAPFHQLLLVSSFCSSSFPSFS